MKKYKIIKQKMYELEPINIKKEEEATQCEITYDNFTEIKLTKKDKINETINYKTLFSNIIDLDPSSISLECTCMLSICNHKNITKQEEIYNNFIQIKNIAKVRVYSVIKKHTTIEIYTGKKDIETFIGYFTYQVCANYIIIEEIISNYDDYYAFFMYILYYCGKLNCEGIIFRNVYFKSNFCSLCQETIEKDFNIY